MLLALGTPRECRIASANLVFVTSATVGRRGQSTRFAELCFGSQDGTQAGLSGAVRIGSQSPSLLLFILYSISAHLLVAFLLLALLEETISVL